jgi:glycosyltransferase involved in cell wall biosynthesis
MKNITFILNDIVGGIATMNLGIIEQTNLILYRDVRLILIREKFSICNHIEDCLKIPDGVNILYFEWDRLENYYYTLKTLQSVIEEESGIVITNDGIELEAIKLFGTKQTIYHIVHDLYNLKLAVNSREIIDYFICHTAEMSQILSSDPNLRNAVFYLPYGVVVNNHPNRDNDILKILFLGRLVKSKGVHHLIEIENLLQYQGVNVDWIIAGEGNLETQLKIDWENKKNVLFATPNSEELNNIFLECDIFISLSEFEGYGISLLESMSNGLIPIITKLPIGIHNILPQNLGLVIDKFSPEEICSFIGVLDKDRYKINELALECRKFIELNFDSEKTSTSYLKIFDAFDNKRVNGNALKSVSNFGLIDTRLVPNKIAYIIKKLRKHAIS